MGKQSIDMPSINVRLAIPGTRCSISEENTSRTKLERLISEGAILLDDMIVKPGTMVKTNQRIRMDLTLF